MAGMMNGSGQAGHVALAVAFTGLPVPREPNKFKRVEGKRKGQGGDHF